MIETLLERYPNLKVCESDIRRATELFSDCYRSGGKVLLCGNGGSCADCDHIVGELMKGFLSKRTLNAETVEQFRKSGIANAEEFCGRLQGSLPAISLPSQTALISAFANDVCAENVYAQLTYGYAKKNDVLVCLSTSGNSVNVVNAALVARALGVKTVAMTGSLESKLSAICDVTIRVPETETYKVQELHLPVYHAICAEIEEEFY